ncbi:hypothetical protein [Haloarcula salinisoli]|uniref:TrbL/VirB6 plasmid conjugal transfer protein n=1 Tax=Haloarcula salinisoli TaxID=2487746 RepID=A0A8J7YH79_9EURY|nr:hypothetical protein [Halomicroarcula salinisoli]MBX0305447.1 hypothetical protein [Halomicroarcula salinisoli]
MGIREDLRNVMTGIVEFFLDEVEEIFEDAATEFSSAITERMIRQLIVVPNPYESATAGNVFNGVFDISLILLPIFFAVALVAWPFGENREFSIVEMIIRLVMAIFFIGISQPAWGFAIDVTNAVTIGMLDYDPTVGGAFGSYESAGDLASTLSMVISLFTAFLTMLAVIFTIFFLLLRWFIVYLVFIGTPFFVALWFVGRGPLEAVGNVGATYLKMGVYAILSGPIISLVILTMALIENGGFVESADGIAGTAASLAAEIALIMIFPIILVVVVWKQISWAGKPLGVGEAATTATLAAAAAVGTVATGGVGGVVAGGGAAAGGAGAAGAGGAGGAAGASGAGASGASAAGTSSLGSGGSGLASRMGSVAQRGRKFATGQSQTLSKVDDSVSSGVNKVSETASGVADKANPVSQFNNFVDKKKDAAKHASETSEFVSDAITSGELDLQRASELGVISQNPAEEASATVYTDGDSGATMASYQDSSGRTQTVNLTEEQQAAGDLAQRGYESVNNWEAAQTAGQKTSEAGKAAGGSTKKGAKMAGFTIPRNVAKVGSSALVGAAGGNPYLAYSGTRKSSSNMIIGPDKSVRSGRRPPEESTLDEFGKAAAGEPADSGDIK